jgi:hypothetical protein
MIAVLGNGERGSVLGNPPVLDCSGQGQHFSVRAGTQVLLEGIHLRSPVSSAALSSPCLCASPCAVVVADRQIAAEMVVQQVIKEQVGALR